MQVCYHSCHTIGRIPPTPLLCWLALKLLLLLPICIDPNLDRLSSIIGLFPRAFSHLLGNDQSIARVFNTPEMSKSPSAERLTSALSGLKVSTNNPTNKTSAKASKNEEVVESWDDEDNEEAVDEASSLPDVPSKHKRNPSDYPNAPPPTPATTSPTMSAQAAQSFQGIDSAFDDVPITPQTSRTTPASTRRNDSAAGEEKRPEKSTAVASRLIAAGLGVKAPKRTEEQRAYDKAMREQERKRKEKEIQDRKKAEENREKAKRSMWED